MLIAICLIIYTLNALHTRCDTHTHPKIAIALKFRPLWFDWRPFQKTTSSFALARAHLHARTLCGCAMCLRVRSRSAAAPLLGRSDLRGRGSGSSTENLIGFPYLSPFLGLLTSKTALNRGGLLSRFLPTARPNSPPSPGGMFRKTGFSEAAFRVSRPRCLGSVPANQYAGRRTYR